MTKSAELQILSEAIAKLGEDSYLAGWLKEVSHEVADNIRGDIFPTVLMADTRKVADTLLKEAKEKAEEQAQRAGKEAERQLAGAKAEAAALVQRAEDKARAILSAQRHQISDLRRALNAIEF